MENSRQHFKQNYENRIVGKFVGDKIWWIDSFQAFSERKFGELTDQPIGY